MRQVMLYIGISTAIVALVWLAHITVQVKSLMDQFVVQEREVYVLSYGTTMGGYRTGGLTKEVATWEEVQALIRDSKYSVTDIKRDKQRRLVSDWRSE